MRLRVALVLALSLTALHGHPHAGPTRAAAGSPRTADGWPDTRAGVAARAWVTAFDAGDEAMRAFYAQSLAAESVKQRPIEARMGNYAKLRERYGRLTFGEVVTSKPAELTVTLLDADAASHTFVFTVQPRSPWKLVSVGSRQRQASHGHGGFHH